MVGSIFRRGEIRAIMDRIAHDAADHEEAMGYVKRNVILAAGFSGLLADPGGPWQCTTPTGEKCGSQPSCLWHRLDDGDRRLVAEMVALVDYFHSADDYTRK